MSDYIPSEKDKYIKLSQALEVLDSCCCWWAHDRMEFIPAADVRPVVRGRWEKCRGGDMCICSACYKYYIAVDEQYDFNYCPNCGADMRPPKEET